MGKIAHAVTASEDTLWSTDWVSNSSHTIGGTGDIDVVRSATLVIAASDASAHVKAQADYVCDGTADQVEIQSAIDALPVGGGKVFLSEGQFNLATVAGGQCIGLNSNVWLQGSGMRATKLFVGNGVQKNAVGAVSKSGIHISDLEIDGNKVNNVETAPSGDTYQNGIYFGAVTDSIIEKVYSHDAIFHGIFLVGSSSRNKVLNTNLSNNRYRGIHAHNGCSYNVYAKNYLFENGDGVATLGGMFVIMDGCCYNVIIGNTIKDDHVYGMQISGRLNTANDSYGNAIVGNTIDCNAYAGVNGILFANAATGLYNTVIANNNISVSRIGIASEVSAFLDRTTIGGNIIKGAVSGLRVLAGGDGLVITNNSFLSATEMEVLLVNVVDSVFSNNILNIVGYYGSISHSLLKLEGCQRNVITDNYFENGYYAIWEANATCLNNTIKDNRAHDIAIAPYFILNNDDLKRAFEHHSDLFMDVLAASATHLLNAEDVSAFAGGETPAIVAQPDVPRNITITSVDAAAGAPVLTMSIIITGIDAKGNTVSETFATSGNETKTGNVAFAAVTSQEVDVIAGNGVGDTLSVGIGIKLGLSNVIYATGDVYKIKKNNANATVAVAQVNATYDTYDMSVITLSATDDFTIWYRSNLNVID